MSHAAGRGTKTSPVYTELVRLHLSWAWNIWLGSKAKYCMHNPSPAGGADRQTPLYPHSHPRDLFLGFKQVSICNWPVTEEHYLSLLFIRPWNILYTRTLMRMFDFMCNLYQKSEWFIIKSTHCILSITTGWILNKALWAFKVCLNKVKLHLYDFFFKN